MFSWMLHSTKLCTILRNIPENRYGSAKQARAILFVVAQERNCKGGLHAFEEDQLSKTIPATRSTVLIYGRKI